MGDKDILVVLGTRPEIIKLAPVIDSLEHSSLSYGILNTSQHYDNNMSGTFFDKLEIPNPDYSLEVKSGSHGEQTSEALVGIESKIFDLNPDIVVAQGDTNTVLSTAIATSKTDPKFAHVEAGLRSFDRSMPEEINRVLADQVSDIAFAPTETAAINMEKEGISKDSIHIVGNTVVDAARQHIKLAQKKSNILRSLGLNKDEYIVSTIHRPINTDNLGRLKTILDELNKTNIPVIFPVHPRTENKIDEIEFEKSENLRLINPVDYLDFLMLESNAKIIVTDSGGIQEEASLFEIPCITVRPNTERPETIESGVNTLVEPQELSDTMCEILNSNQIYNMMTGNPTLYGQTGVGDNIVDILNETINRTTE